MARFVAAFRRTLYDGRAPGWQSIVALLAIGSGQPGARLDDLRQAVAAVRRGALSTGRSGRTVLIEPRLDVPAAVDGDDALVVDARLVHLEADPLVPMVVVVDLGVVSDGHGEVVDAFEEWELVEVNRARPGPSITSMMRLRRRVLVPKTVRPWRWLMRMPITTSRSIVWASYSITIDAGRPDSRMVVGLPFWSTSTTELI